MTDLESVTGLGPAASKKLKEAFITTAELLAVQNPVKLHELTKLGEGTCAKLVKSARILLGHYGFKSGLDLERELASKPKLSTGIEKLDELLLGGFEVGSIIEFFGPARGGKTQWCSQLAVRVQLPKEQGGLEGRALWLDTESSLKPWVIRSNALRYGLDPDVTLGNIGYSKIVLSDQISELFESIPRMCAEENVKLVVVDSLTGLFRVEYGGLSLLRSRQHSINSLLNLMRRTGAATDTIFVYSNQVMANISPYGGSSNHPTGGHIVSHASDYRFYTRRTKDTNRKLTLQDNAAIPEFDVDLQIGYGGFYPDIKSKKDAEPGILEYFEKRGWSTAIEEDEPEVLEAEAAKVIDSP